MDNFKKILLFVLLLPSISVLAQKRIALLGMETGGAGIQIQKEAVSADKNLCARTSQFIPKVGFFISDNFMLAVQGGRSFFRSNFLPKEDFPTIYFLGFLGRYYLPKKIETGFKVKSKRIALSFLPYVEYNHLWTNHLIKKDSTRFVNSGKRLDFQIINPQLGVNIKLGKSFIFDIGYRLLFQYNNLENQLGFNRIAPKVGLEYLISSKAKQK
jgi:hypothetical protein